MNYNQGCKRPKIPNSQFTRYIGFIDNLEPLNGGITKQMVNLMADQSKTYTELFRYNNKTETLRQLNHQYLQLFMRCVSDVCPNAGILSLASGRIAP